MGSGNKKTLLFLGIFLGLWLFARYLLPLVFPFLLGLGLALAARPAVTFLTEKLRFPRYFSAGIGVTLTFFSIATLFLLLCAFLVRELKYLAGILPDLEQTARSGISLLESWLLGLTDAFPAGIAGVLRQNVAGLFSGGTALLDRAVRYLLGLAGSLLAHVPDSALTLGTALISGYMISAKLPRIALWLEKRFPKEKWKPLLEALKRIRQVVAGWLLAQLKLSCLTFGILTGGFLLLRIPYALLWALGVALLDAFPVLGTGTVLLPWALIAFLQGNSARAIGLLGTYAVVSLVRSALEPKLVGRQLGLDPLVTLMALYAGYKIWGIGGMILAPMLTVTALQLVPDRKER